MLHLTSKATQYFETPLTTPYFSCLWKRKIKSGLTKCNGQTNEKGLLDIRNRMYGEDLIKTKKKEEKLAKA